jgi:hypothetical protein
MIYWVAVDAWDIHESLPLLVSSTTPTVVSPHPALRNPTEAHDRTGSNAASHKFAKLAPIPVLQGAHAPPITREFSAKIANDHPKPSVDDIGDRFALQSVL